MRDEPSSPQARFKRFSAAFGRQFYRWTPKWLSEVPRVRVRTSESRKMDELLDLAVLNGEVSLRSDMARTRV